MCSLERKSSFVSNQCGEQFQHRFLGKFLEKHTRLSLKCQHSISCLSPVLQLCVFVFNVALSIAGWTTESTQYILSERNCEILVWISIANMTFEKTEYTSSIFYSKYISGTTSISPSMVVTVLFCTVITLNVFFSHACPFIVFSFCFRFAFRYVQPAPYFYTVIRQQVFKMEKHGMSLPGGAQVWTRRIKLVNPWHPML